MKCPNCGAEIGSKDVCEYCGTHVSLEMKKEQEQLNKQGCPKCGSTNIRFNRENQGEVRDKNSKQIIHRTVGYCQDCGYTWYPNNIEDEMPQKRKTWLWVLGWIFFFPAPVMVLIWRKKNKWDIKIKIAVTVVFWLLIFILGSSDNKSTEADTTTDSSVQTEKSTAVEEPQAEKETDKTTTDSQIEESVDESAALKQVLKDKYDVSEPSSFVRGDSTGKWRIVKVANGTPPTEYAIDYAKAYMTEGDVHYIVNFSLKTTTQLRLQLGKLSLKTTEYVDKEEHDASIIGEGMVLVEKYYDMETGEEVSTEGDASAGTVDANELIKAVKEAIDGQIGEGEKIADVSFDGEELIVKVDLSGADTSRLSPELLAESRTSSITDGILQLEDKYYNTWNKITVDFGSVGSISFNKNEVKDQGLGRYFEVPVGYFE